MAYFYDYYNNNQTVHGEYNETTSSNDNTHFLPQDYEPSIYNLFDYDPIPFTNYHTYHNNQNYSYTDSVTPSWSSITTTAYSTYTPEEAEFQRYYYHQPKCHKVATTSFYYNQAPPAEAVTTELFNAPKFDEYDSTPYGGGYDIVQTYGRPLSPSDQICYPRHGSQLKPNTKEEEKEVKDTATEPKKEARRKEEEKKVKDTTTEPAIEEGPAIGGGVIPSGYGLEAMDLCGSPFGYWPCLAKYYANTRPSCGVYAAADYLFGGTDPYVELRDGGGTFGLPIHCYNRHRHELPLTVFQADDRDQSSRDLQSFGIF